MKIVALEFGYSEENIIFALENIDFNCAGDLVDFLYEHRSSLKAAIEEHQLAKRLAEIALQEEQEKELQEKREAEAAIELKKTPEKVVTIYDETLDLLYSRSCRLCKVNLREIIHIPCCHFSVCTTCNRGLTHCPLPKCRECIETSIKTIIP